MTRISAFADCASESIVLRIPYKLLADMLKNCPPSENLTELMKWLNVAKARSSKLQKILNDN